ncbi:hypothetical protein B0A54_14208 [Friedmanniomyces endolithicus]|uniref:Uncharacterized protein n=1 Tax=Friedmanniomyces endolithicus TaxID=329885 RepID=A0A4U0UIP3_9PEZI|nr:hypothetical protein B0A54_18097 [Friedmanniomyces endolithicus]TKA34505.1 hypothetical protein B0A54_14208 [Friedmanniomyces endolithicus]
MHAKNLIPVALSSIMNEYESRRLDKIKANQDLLAGLDIKPVDFKRTRNVDIKPPAAKRRKVFDQSVPSRTSARIAAVPGKPSYNDEPSIKPISLPLSASRKTKANKNDLASRHANQTEPLVPVQDVETIKAGWTAWKPIGKAPTRDPSTKEFHFPDYPDFTPNKSPAEMLREGCFGGSYYRSLRSAKLGIVIKDDWRELPTKWTEGLDVARYLTSPTYDADVNKYKVPCGQSIEEWEAAGWISHSHDVRGWFQWYTRFYLGRRCKDDERQVSRWRKCVGPRGRWRSMLLKRYCLAGVREVFDDGAEEDAVEVSPVMHQTCHHWGFEVRQEHLDGLWAGG